MFFNDMFATRLLNSKGSAGCLHPPFVLCFKQLWAI